MVRLPPTEHGQPGAAAPRTEESKWSYRLGDEAEDEDEIVERARREAPPNITIGELHSLLAATFGDQWTQEEEDELDRAMNDDPVVVALLDPSTGRHGGIGGLWKATLYSMRETPDRLMSAPLRVSTRQHKALPRHGNMRNPNMNQMYCTHLIVLVSHPIWERDIRALRQTIAFAVACHTKDQRPWKFETMVGGSVLAEFGRQAAASDGSQTMASLFRQISNGAAGEKPPLVLLMDELAGDGDDDVEEGDFDDDEAEVEYEVQLRHLASVIKSLDTLVPRFKPTAHYERLACKARSERHIPSIKTQLPDVRRRSLLRERRLAAIQDKGLTPEASELPESSNSGDSEAGQQPPESLSIPPTQFSEERAVEVPETPSRTQYPQIERTRTVEPIERLPPLQGSLHLETPARTAIPPEEASIAAAAPAVTSAKRTAAPDATSARPAKRVYKNMYTAKNRTVAARPMAGPNAQPHESHESNDLGDLGDLGDSSDSMGPPAVVSDSEASNSLGQPEHSEGEQTRGPDVRGHAVVARPDEASIEGGWPSSLGAAVPRAAQSAARAAKPTSVGTEETRYPASSFSTSDSAPPATAMLELVGFQYTGEQQSDQHRDQIPIYHKSMDFINPARYDCMAEWLADS